MALVEKTNEWKKWVLTNCALPVYNQLYNEWVVCSPDNTTFIAVPHDEYMEWWENHPAFVKRREA